MEYLNNQLNQSLSDLSLIYRIKQGHVEINNDKPVPELEELLLINKKEIDEKN